MESVPTNPLLVSILGAPGGSSTRRQGESDQNATRARRSYPTRDAVRCLSSDRRHRSGENPRGWVTGPAGVRSSTRRRPGSIAAGVSETSRADHLHGQPRHDSPDWTNGPNQGGDWRSSGAPGRVARFQRDASAFRSLSIRLPRRTGGWPSRGEPGWRGGGGAGSRHSTPGSGTRKSRRRRRATARPSRRSLSPRRSGRQRRRARGRRSPPGSGGPPRSRSGPRRGGSEQYDAARERRPRACRRPRSGAVAGSRRP